MKRIFRVKRSFLGLLKLREHVNKSINRRKQSNTKRTLGLINASNELFYVPRDNGRRRRNEWH
jgi:hypothetical protein